MSIEHPSIVKNFDNGFKSLGGEHHLKHVRLASLVFPAVFLTSSRFLSMTFEVARAPHLLLACL